MNWAGRIGLGLGWTMLACGGRPDGATTTTTTAETGDSGGSGSFVGRPDGGVRDPLCDFFGTDCPDGHKCAGYDVDADGTPDETRCVEVVPNASPLGAPCSLDPSTGQDDCALGLTCFDAQDGNGRCVANCVAAPSVDAGAPRCADPDERCLPGGGPLHVCLAACDPRQAACPDPSDACYPSSDWLLCLPDVSGTGGGTGDPCTFVNGCDPGHACMDAAMLSGCGATSCCRPFCTLGDDGPCPAGERCQAWTPGQGVMLPETLAGLGVCRAD